MISEQNQAQEALAASTDEGAKQELRFLVLLEPLIVSRKIEKLCRRFKMESDFTQDDGVAKILVMWREPLKFIPYHCHDQVVTFQVEERGQASAVFSFVYAKCTVGERRE